MKLSELLRGLTESGSVEEELTRRYYVAIAEILRPYAREKVARQIAMDLADFLARDNPSFERERFLRAAGMAFRPEVTTESAHEPVPVSEVYEPDLRKFVQGYLKAALWSSTDEEGEPLDKTYDVDDFSGEAVKKATEDAKKFIEDNEDDLDATGASYEQHGHDFWLTRNRHGSGFWDRGYGEAGKRLTKAAHSYGEAYVYVGDDGKLYIEE